MAQTDAGQAATDRPPVHRVGVIGFGRIGRRRAELVRDHPQLALVAVADDPHILDAGALPASIARHPTGTSLLADHVDAVFVCTPNAVTADLVVDALEAGKHVFAEKPPGRCLAD